MVEEGGVKPHSSSSDDELTAATEQNKRTQGRRL
jgi:hypothetical protein